LKTKEQRAAEKALMDKSPLKTLTLEDFLESERHKLTGILTPVTPETFAKWKAERMDKKAAEDQARLAKEATGRALFEKGDWEASGDEDEEDDGEEDDDDTWNMEKLRQETEALKEKKEAERIAGYSQNTTTNGSKNLLLGNFEPDINGATEEGEES
jgi:DRG Family Regulatory Proteins, Tma46